MITNLLFSEGGIKVVQTVYYRQLGCSEIGLELARQMATRKRKRLALLRLCLPSSDTDPSLGKESQRLLGYRGRPNYLQSNQQKHDIL
jgi:hypothetical protein